MFREKIKVVDKNGLVGYHFHEQLMTFGTLYQGCVIHLQKEPYVVEMLEVDHMHAVTIKVRRLGR
ncbi:hypothetical protein DIGNKC_38 [Bacillus phage DIGNKC]|uniref:hypothetical protein n=1 Tax=Bacillus phage DIGNKC TaxID=1805948 RepID=UPI0007A769C3|nr:hypothetical protein BI007_gp038 [Bacillus phage DIGNKC]YP_009280413.1 hypothetical protein BI039_gp039 [Bacillus phage Belinda]AMW62722.1 hypothetical protein DIGNKC_38 [Bacillus phage DIGNKC]ANM45968.1 hypothetical protein BELINDA_39 [Bacillus phage Belinda]